MKTEELTNTLDTSIETKWGQVLYWRKISDILELNVCFDSASLCAAHVAAACKADIKPSHPLDGGLHLIWDLIPSSQQLAFGNNPTQCNPPSLKILPVIYAPGFAESTLTMLTPAFDLSQNPEYLIFSIRVPYTRTSDFDVYIDGTDFKFYAKPYFLRWLHTGMHINCWIVWWNVFFFSDSFASLSIENCGCLFLLFVTVITWVNCCFFSRLSLPGRIVEDGREKAKFDINKGRSHTCG